MFDLFTKDVKPEILGNKLPYNMAEWDKYIMNQLENIIDSSKFGNIKIEYKKADANKGNAVGTIVISMGNNAAYIPLIIHEYFLQPFDIFYFNGKGLPLRNDLLMEMLSNKLLMLKTINFKKMFPSQNLIEGKNLLQKFSCTKEEQTELLKKTSEEYQDKIKTIPIIVSEPEKLAFFFMDKIGFDKYLTKYAFEKDSVLTIREKTLNYQNADKMMKKIGKEMHSLQLPFRIQYKYVMQKNRSGEPQPDPQYKPILELDFSQLTKGGILITTEGKIDSGRIYPLINEDTNVIGRIFIGRKNYGLANQFYGVKLAGNYKNRWEFDDNRPSSVNFMPRKGDKCVFIFALKDRKPILSLFFETNKYQYDRTDNAVAMGPFEYMYSKKDRNGMHYYVTKNLQVYEFIVSSDNTFMENLIEKKNNSFYIPKPMLCRLEGQQTKYLGSKDDLNSKLALWNPTLSVRKTGDKYVFNYQGKTKLAGSEDAELILSRLGKKKVEEPIMKYIMNSKVKKDEKERAENKETGNDQNDENVKQACSKIKRIDFLKEAEELHFDEGIDAALSLNLITPQRIQQFVDALPDFERVMNTACDMLLAARLGEKRISPDLLRSFIDKLYNVIEILQILK